MGWIVAIVIFAIIAAALDSIAGKIVFGSGVVAIALLMLSWITGFAFLITLAKACAVIIVIALAVALLLAIIG